MHKKEVVNNGEKRKKEEGEKGSKKSKKETGMDQMKRT